MRSNDTMIPDWKLERYLLGELPAQELEQIAELLKEDTTIQQRVEAIKLSNESIENEYSPDWVLRQIKQKADATHSIRKATTETTNVLQENQVTQHSWVSMVLSPAGTKVISAFSMLILVAVMVVYYSSHMGDGIRSKGLGPYILLHKKTQDASVQLFDKSTVSQGDWIQIQYQSKDKKYGVIVSLDGNNTITVHLPESGESSEELHLNEKVQLNFSYELDDAPKMERFYFITSDSKFSITEVTDALKKESQAPTELKFLDLSQQFFQYHITLIKGGQNEK